MQKRYDLCFVTALVLLTLASVSEVLANGAYPDPLGGSGGSPYDDKCKPGDYLVGFDYWSGKALNGMRPKCAALRGGKWAGGLYSKEMRGSAPCTYSGFFCIDPVDRSVTCPRDQFVTSFHVWWDNFGIVHHFRMNCHSEDRTSKASFTTENEGGEPNHDRGVACPIGMLAFGVHGRSGALIDSIGPICRDP
jgi:hypothetical protein